MLLLIRRLQQSRQQIKNMLEDRRVDHTYDLVVLILTVLVVRAVEGSRQRLLQDGVLVILVWCLVVIGLDNFHDEGNECVDEDIAAIVVLAPLLEQVQKLLTKISLAVLVLKNLQQLGCDLRRHLGHGLLVDLREGLEGLDG